MLRSKLKTSRLYLSECTDIFLQEFAMCLPIYGKTGGNDSAICSTFGPFSIFFNEFEFEIGKGTVNNKIESVVIQLSMNIFFEKCWQKMLGKYINIEEETDKVQAKKP